MFILVLKIISKKLFKVRIPNNDNNFTIERLRNRMFPITICENLQRQQTLLYALTVLVRKISEEYHISSLYKRNYMKYNKHVKRITYIFRRISHE